MESTKIGKRIRNRRGFTLIEQVVAIASVAVVSSVVVPGVVKQLSKAEVSRISQDLDAVEAAAKNFRVHVSAWPDSLNDLRTVITTADKDVYGNAFSVASVASWEGAYVDVALINSDGNMTSGANSVFNNDFDWTYHKPKNNSLSRFLVIMINNVSQDYAKAVSVQIDGEEELGDAAATTLAGVTAASTTTAATDVYGRVRWFKNTGAATGNPLGTLVYLAGPID